MLKQLFTGALILAAVATNAQIDYESVNDGDWGEATNWDPEGVPGEDDNAFIVNEITSSGRIKINELFIDADASLTITGGSTSKIYGEFYIEEGGTFTHTRNVDAYADYFNYGEHTGTADFRFRASGSMEGIGLVTGTVDFQVRVGDRTIEDGTEISFPKDFRLYAGTTVENFGNITVGQLDASGSTGAFINQDNAVVTIKNSVDADLLITASAQDNKFIYETNLGVSRSINLPVNGGYWDLTIRGEETTTERRIGEPITIQGDLEIDNARFFCRDSGVDAAFSINGDINILNGGVFDPAQSTFTFTNELITVVQEINSTSPVTFYNMTMIDDVAVRVNQDLEARGDLNIQGSLDLNSGGNFQLTLGGNLNTTWPWDLSTNKMVANGVDPQMLTSELTVMDLDINNVVGVQIANGPTASGGESSLTLVNYMQVLAGDFTTNDRLTLKSDENNTANLGPINPANAVIGGINYQRYMARPTVGYAQLCYPVENENWTNINDNIVTTGLEGSDFPDHLIVNIKTYNETVEGGLNQGFEDIVALSDAIDPLQGYFVLLVDGPQTVDCAGTIKQQEQNFTLNYTPLSGTGNDGWNLIANPYPCTLDWDAAAGWNKNGLDGAIYVYDATTNAMATYSNGVGVNGGTQFIPSGQAFWVITNQVSPSLSVNEAAKVNQQGTFRDETEVPSHFKLKILTENTQDEIAIVTQAGSSQSFEEGLDAVKSPTPEGEAALTLSSVSTEGHLLSINTIGEIQGNEILPLKIEVPAAGTYQFEANNTADFGASCFFLYDNQTQQSYSLVGDNSFEISFSDEELVNENRFAIHLAPGATLDVEQPVCAGSNDGSAIVDIAGQGPFTFEWINEAGETIYNHNSDFGSSSLDGLAPGTYMVNIDAANTACTSQQVMIEIDYPEEISIEATTAQACFGTENGAIELDIEGGQAPYAVSWSNGETGFSTENLAPGEYEATVADENGCSKTATVLVTEGAEMAADFDVLTNITNTTMEVTFLPQIEADSYFWDFGNGETSTAAYPVHSFEIDQIVAVSMTATVGGCEVSATQEINTYAVGVSEIATQNLSIVRVGDQIEVRMPEGASAQTTVSVHNLLGQTLVATQQMGAGATTLSIDLPLGQPLFISVRENGKLLKAQKTL